VVVRLKACLQVLLAVLSLGIINPQPACAAGTSEPGMTCCCTGSPICQCHPNRPCKQSCALSQVQAPLDKQLPTKAITAASATGLIAPLSIALTKVSYPSFAPLVRRQDLNASPPFGGHSSQAVLRLWLI
jgi:hypothetical protein